MSDSKPNKIQCPNCNTSIDVNQVLAQQLSEELRSQYEAKAEKDRKQLNASLNAIEVEKQKLNEEKQRHQQAVEAEVKQQLKFQTDKIRREIISEVTEEQGERLKLLQQELNTKSEQLKAFNKAKAEIEKLKREKDELKDSVEAEAARKLNDQLAVERQKIIKAESERSQLNLSEKEKVIEQLKEQLDIAKRKAEQGSTQLQGEVQELAIEQWLVEHFPLDSIEEIKKGARGADCLQVVNTHSRHNCGTIYYESKRTQNFQPSWIEKFKNDIREKGADIGVLVTEAMPNDMQRMGMKDGIWICTFDEFKGLCLVLRESVIRMSRAIAVQDNKGDKMAMLYDFLTGNEFRMQVEAIVEGFTQMQEDLVKEKRAMSGIWKKREKQIEKVLLNTTHMYSSVQGIAGSAVKSLPMLELGDDEALD
ncbi:DUF2130 domain-containing protein [Aliikangiella marina]|uniref:DUF2130 domain-containing protein n=1 Tax=Aliikangiella marina TaxID=1712262 RepID=A0A545TD68_9GAMM|nr:DUF2130 domain-containing protein [Aliikangiella marina]TQV75163.1 DUF2130 domain-containing protein [Aliikangiella marina]